MLGDRLVGIQSTSWQQRTPHLIKIYNEHGNSTRSWLATGNELWLISWKKRPIKKGSKRFRYEPHIDIIEAKTSTEV